MYTFCQGPGPLYLRAFALRGTMYTLISNIDEAIQDLTQVIDAESLEDLTKVLLQLPCVNLLAFCQESFTPNCQSPSFKYPVFWNHKIFGERATRSSKKLQISEPFQTSVECLDSELEPFGLVFKFQNVHHTTNCIRLYFYPLGTLNDR